MAEDQRGLAGIGKPSLQFAPARTDWWRLFGQGLSQHLRRFFRCNLPIMPVFSC